MDKSRLLFLYNPCAGIGKVSDRLGEIVERIAAAGYEVTVHPTSAAGDAIKAAAESEGYDRLICAGGDGTLNDFAASLSIPKDLSKALDVALGGVPFYCDMGRLGERNFVYVAAFGLFTDVSYATPQSMKTFFGYMAYVLEGMKRLGNIQTFHCQVEHDGQVDTGDYIFGAITNSISIGGIKGFTGDHVLLDDGLFEVILIRQPVNLAEFNDIIGGLLKKESSDRVDWFRTDRLRLRSDSEVSWTIDGEYGGSQKEIIFEGQKRALGILVDPKRLNKLPTESECLPQPEENA